jgi:predicted MFS family arabinose efflux permease
MTTVVVPFVRDRFTWLAYFMLSYYAYLQAGLGPLMPFLAAEVGMTYTERGLHLSAFALGMIIAGATGDRAAKRLGRSRVFWGGGAGMALGAVALTLSHQIGLTILSAFIMGTLGSYLLVMIQATLADHHGDRRAVAITESNVYASLAAMFAPLLISQLEGLALGWRAAMYLALGCWLIAVFVWRHESIPERLNIERALSPRNTADHLPRIFWLYWLIVLFSVSAEWCIVFWGADFLENVVGLTRVNASAALAIYFLGFVIGRAAGSRLTRLYSTQRLLLTAAALLIVGFPIFWLVRLPIISLIGIFIAGLGLANLFPLTLSTVTNLAPTLANQASARTSLAAGIAILVTPQILGTAADSIGIDSAFVVVAALSICILVLVTATLRLTAKPIATTTV